MTELLTAAQMRTIERAAIESGAVTGLELMERAGQGVVDAIMDWRPELATAPHRAVVLCGPGNNGGDGFVVARLLMERGWDVELFLYGDRSKLPPDAAENARRWQAMAEIRPSSELTRQHLRDDFDLRVDAVFGTGLARALEGEAKSFCETLHAIGPEVCIDIPSGFCADSGRHLGAGSDARAGPVTEPLVVTFHAPKIGLFLAPCCERIGRLVRADIGLEHVAPSAAGARIVTEAISADGLGKCAGDHKYRHGHALILSGGVGRGGAARLAARGALRIGAGLVTVGCPPAAVMENAARLDAVMLTPVADAGALMADVAARKVGAVGIGPGFGAGARLRSFLAALLDNGVTSDTSARLSLVLDADALTEYREDPETLFGLLHEGCVLTPHEGEFGRLFPDILAKLKAPAERGPAYSKVDATREAAARAGCVVLFKGADTVIAAPDGRCSINAAVYDRAAPWLATAGAGDVLSGFITGLLARGFAPMAAAETAAWLHVECARKVGPGLVAEDLPEQLPAVFRDLGL